MKRRLAFLGLSWIGAWLILMAIFVVFGGLLEDLALPVRVAAISAVLVVSMTQVVIPFIMRRLGMHGGDRRPEPRSEADANGVSDDR